MKYIRTGRYVGYKGMNLILSNYGYIGDEENRDKPDGFYIGINDEKYKDEECYMELSGTEYEYYSKPARAEIIEYIYGLLFLRGDIIYPLILKHFLKLRFFCNHFFLR